MKNTINYFYNLEPNEIFQSNKTYKFVIDNQNYLFLPVWQSVEQLEELDRLSKTLLAQGIYTHQFIVNINLSLITMVNDVPYVLLLNYVTDSRVVVLSDIIWFSNLVVNIEDSVLKTNNWFSLWTKKIDHFEYQVSHFGKSFPLLRESFSYYNGLAETSIIFLKNVNPNYESSLSLAHHRLKKETTIFDLYNPLNFVIDSKSRNLAEFIKYNYFLGNNLTFELFEFLNGSVWSENELLLFYARMLFPSYYFDLFDEIVYNNLDEKIILKIIHKVNDYELFLKELHDYLKKRINIPSIEWLVNYY